MKRIVSVLLTLCLILSMIPAAFALGDNQVYYNGEAYTPEPTVELDDGTPLIKGTDYTVSYEDNVNAGTARVIIKGTSKYPDYYQVLTFEILPRPITVKVEDQVYSGDTPDYKYSYSITGGKGLVDGESLGEPVYNTVSTSTSKGVKTDIVSVSFPAAKNYDVTVSTGTVTTFLTSGGGEAVASISIDSIPDVTFNGNDQTPAITVRNGAGAVLNRGTDYSAAFSNNKNAGTATVFVTGMNAYAGKKASATFVINKRTVIVTVSDVTVKQGLSYSGKWTASQDLCNGDRLPNPTMTLPTSAQKPGVYKDALKATFPVMDNYNILVKAGTLTILENPDYDGPIADGGQQSGQTGETTTKDYYIDASCSAGGSISPSGRFQVKNGETVAFEIKPDKGYTVKAVYVDGKAVDIKNGYTFSNLGEDKTVYVEFERIDGAQDPEKDKTQGQQTDAAKKFTDVPSNAWYLEYLQDALNRGIISGTSDTTFAPNAATTRGMIVTILHSLENRPMVFGSSPFRDVADSAWYADSVKWANAVGIVSGYGDGTFGPDDNITREQLVTILYRYAQYKGCDVSKRANLYSFPDNNQVSDWADTGMYWGVGIGLISGRKSGDVTLIAPKDFASRAELVTVITNLMDYYNL